MTNVIIFTNQDDQVCLMQPCDDVYIKLSNGDFETYSSQPMIPVFSEDNEITWISDPDIRPATIEEIAERDVPKLGGTEFFIVERESLPSDPYFFKAWVNSRGSISIDMARAREVQKSVLTVLAEPKIESLMDDLMMSLASGNVDQAAIIAAKRQQLINITNSPEISEAASLEELKQAGLSILNQP